MQNYFRDGGAIKIQDGMVYFVYNCQALEAWNRRQPFPGILPPFRVTPLPDRKAAEDQFKGPIVPPDRDPRCNCRWVDSWGERGR
jgi:hypothetical protein